MFNFAYKFFVKKYITLKYQNIESHNVPKNEMISRVLDQQKRMPDFLGFGIKCVTLLFLGKIFLVQIISLQKVFSTHITDARNSSFSLFRNLIRFHDSIFEIANVSENLVRDIPKTKNRSKKLNFDFVVIGSGPGGSVSARELQKAGFKTCILEAGQSHAQNGVIPFSYFEMLNLYKHAGITPFS